MAISLGIISKHTLVGEAMWKVLTEKFPAQWLLGVKHGRDHGEIGLGEMHAVLRCVERMVRR